MDNEQLNILKFKYKIGEPIWVHWDDRTDSTENLITTIGYLVYIDDELITLCRSIINKSKGAKDTIQIPMNLVASYGRLE